MRNDKDFEVPKCQELQGDIFIKYDEHKNLDKAIQQYRMSANGNANNFNLMFKLGRCFDRKREYKESIFYYGKALTLEP